MFELCLELLYDPVPIVRLQVGGECVRVQSRWVLHMYVCTLYICCWWKPKNRDGYLIKEAAKRSSCVRGRDQLKEKVPIDKEVK
jgi:hypothetical protein